MPGIVKGPQTLYDKIFNDHIVEEKEDGTIILYVGMSTLSIDTLDLVADCLHRQTSHT
jgi:homoaconitase/3-isopropylmalate dehydratase large subunit